MSKQKRDNKGFTMVEMLVALIATTMLMTSITTGMMLMSSSYQTSNDKIDLQYQGQTTLNIIVEELKYGKSIAASYHYDGTNYVTQQTSSGKQVIDLFCVEKESGGYTYFYLKDDCLYMKEEATSDFLPNHPDAVKRLKVDSTHLLATQVDTVSLEPHKGAMNKTSTVSIEVAFEKGDEKLTVHSAATMRNKE